ncbi:MAG: hypothetical protein GAK38_02291 [Xylophilus sp.]|nr:MAG: hypothetical protein GAK38_02291 [Xylophilus sp.]
MLAENPALAEGDAYLACAVGDETALRQATARDPGWVHRAGGPLHLPPLEAVTHSGLLTLPGFRERLRDCARFLLGAGASPDQSIGSRWPPASLEAPSFTERLSALYGAAGKARDAALARFLLERGADWRTLHGFGDNACGSLSWASLNVLVEGGDWAGCARALRDHGMPAARRDPGGTDIVRIGAARYRFADEVADVLLGVDDAG